MPVRIGAQLLRGRERGPVELQGIGAGGWPEDHVSCVDKAAGARHHQHMNELPVAVTIAELRADMRNITHRLLEGDSFTLTSYGDPIAVLVPVAEYTNLTTQES